MTNLLVSTGVKSGHWYLLLLAGFGLTVFYWFFTGDPSRKDELLRQAFYLNAKAFENGIYFSRVKFMSNHNRISSIDAWLNQGVGLDYNEAGYPIGTDIDDPYYDKPQNVENCRQVWRFVLGPLQPLLFLEPSDKGYWVELTEENDCIYRPYRYKNLQILYNSANGSIIFVK